MNEHSSRLEEDGSAGIGASEKKTYEYEPLLTPTTIRILLLEPGTGEAPLVGELHHVSKRWDMTSYRMSSQTADSHQIRYEALSYVWGSSDLSSSIATRGGVIPLTANLDEALRRVRDRDRIRRIWADGVCINQNDLKERGHQVRLMGHIYKDAEKVLIWLGPDHMQRASPIFNSLRGLSPSEYTFKNPRMMEAAIGEIAKCE